MVHKIVYSVGLILLAELILLYLIAFVHNFGDAFEPGITRVSVLEEILMFFELTAVFVTPILIPVVVFKEELIRKLGGRRFKLALFLILGGGLLFFFYLMNQILSTFLST
jgi:hypothetical protein